MIITRSPLRITLGGGGTDLPSYYLQNEGFLIAAAIDRYISQKARCTRAINDGSAPNNQIMHVDSPHFQQGAYQL